MGHNISERKRAQREAAARACPGWWPGTWAKMETPLGVLARGGAIHARCSRPPECGRRVTIDCRRWAEMGLGDADLADVRLSYRCALPVCGLTFQPEIYPRGLPLMGWAADEKAFVLVECTCGFGRRLRIADYVRAAVAAGTGGWGMTRAEVGARQVRGACRCGARAWRVRLEGVPAAPPPPGQAP